MTGGTTGETTGETTGRTTGRMSRERPGVGPAWLAAGLAGGVLAGVVDTGVAIVGGIGGLTAARAIRLLLLSVSLVGAAGLAAGGLVVLAVAAARAARLSARARAALAAGLAAPLLVRDGFAAFTGHLAASIPGHGLVSLALAAFGTGAVYLFALRYAGWLGRDGTRAAVLSLAAAALGAALVNRWILPRLYPWFHETLSVFTIAACVLGVRLVLRHPRRVSLVVATALLGGGLVAAVATLRSSQVMRYAAHERTAVTALVLRGVPARWQASSSPASSGSGPAAAPLPPLPDGPHRPDADVLLITIDAVRADHLGAYGYRRATTPNIDALAASGVRFARAYAQAPHTSFSVTSMLTGKYAVSLSRLAPGERHEPVTEVLRHYGWKTAAFYPPAVFYVEGEKLKAYADTHFDFEYAKVEYLDAVKRVDQIRAYYEDVNPGRSFVWVHLFEPHEPYVGHPEHPFGPGDMDRYDSEIAYADAAVGKLVAAVRARRPGTIVIIAADHGEEFDEHGGRYHGSTLFEEQLRIPLIFSIPGVAPHVVEGQAQLVDVAPTVLNLLDIPVPARMRGTDLGPWLASTPAPADRLPPAFAELEDKRMVAAGTDKLLCDLRGGFCAYYDLAADPRERDNLADRRPERAAALRGVLDGWIDAQVRLEPLAESGAGSGGGPVPRAIERGRLGDAAAAPELAALLGAKGASLPERREAAELLVALPPQPATAPLLKAAAGASDGAVADWMAIARFRLGDSDAKPRVQEIAQEIAQGIARKAPQNVPGDREPARARARVRAALALAAAGDATGVDALGEALGDVDDVALKRTIVVALGKLGDRRAVPALVAHLSEVLNRREMVVALGEIGDPAAADALLEHLRSDAYVPVRIEAARALAKLGDRRLVPTLQTLAKHEPEPTVRAATLEAARVLRQGR